MILQEALGLDLSDKNLSNFNFSFVFVIPFEKIWVLTLKARLGASTPCLSLLSLWETRRTLGSCPAFERAFESIF